MKKSVTFFSGCHVYNVEIILSFICKVFTYIFVEHEKLNTRTKSKNEENTEVGQNKEKRTIGEEKNIKKKMKNDDNKKKIQVKKGSKKKNRLVKKETVEEVLELSQTTPSETEESNSEYSMSTEPCIATSMESSLTSESGAEDSGGMS